MELGVILWVLFETTETTVFGCNYLCSLTLTAYDRGTVILGCFGAFWAVFGMVLRVA